MKGELFHEDISDVGISRTWARPLVVSQQLHRCCPTCTTTPSSDGCPTPRACYDGKRGASPHEGRGRDSRTLRSTCLDSRTLELEREVGLGTWLLGHSSSSPCPMGSWTLEASSGWLGLGCWPLEIPLMEIPNGQRDKQ